MIKKDLVKRIASKFHLSINLTNKIIQILLDEAVNGLVLDSRIEIRRFGIFATKKQKSRVITLPSGKEVTRPAQSIVTFLPSLAVKKKLNPPISRIKRRS